MRHTLRSTSSALRPRSLVFAGMTATEVKMRLGGHWEEFPASSDWSRPGKLNCFQFGDRGEVIRPTATLLLSPDEHVTGKYSTGLE